jgi:hypothetical protein
MRETLELKREALYEEVWSEPMSALARKYSLSDVGLTKICRKLKIPVPGRGYWQKKKMDKTPLPPLKFGDADSYTLHREKKDILPIDEAHDVEARSLISLEESPQNKIQVHPRLTFPHPLIEKTLNALNATNPDKYGRVSPHTDKCFSVSITRNSVNRAMRILDALVKRFVERGFPVSFRNDQYNTYRGRDLTYVTVLKQKIEISLEEPAGKVERILTPQEKKDFEKHPWKYSDKYTYVPSGELVLKINNVHWGNIRRCWSDGKKAKLEDCLNDFVIGLIRASSVLRSRDLQREIEKRQREELERQYIEKERAIQEEKNRVSALLQEVKNWNKSRQIREYVDAVKEQAVRNNGIVTSDSALGKWLTWAAQQADCLDPLKKQPVSSFDGINKLSEGCPFYKAKLSIGILP